jgi:type IV pilus assembly protein PilE
MNRHVLLPHSGACKRRSLGVTLIELLITVAIVAIIAAVAIPSYNSYVLRTHRTEAKSALLSMAAAEERFYSTNNSYTSIPTQLGYTGGGFPINVGSSYYSVGMPVAPTAATATLPATYSLTATAIGSQAADTACATLSIDQGGNQTATGSATASVDCWK